MKVLYDLPKDFARWSNQKIEKVMGKTLSDNMLTVLENSDGDIINVVKQKTTLKEETYESIVDDNIFNLCTKYIVSNPRERTFSDGRRYSYVYYSTPDHRNNYLLAFTELADLVLCCSSSYSSCDPSLKIKANKRVISLMRSFEAEDDGKQEVTAEVRIQKK